MGSELTMLSRVAESTYWLARYLERAEHASRVVEVNLHLMLDQRSSPDKVAENRWQRLMDALSCELDPGESPVSVYRAVECLTFERENPNAILACVERARENSRSVREQISTEMFEQLNAMHLQVQLADMPTVWGQQPYLFFRQIHRGALLFHEITNSTLSHEQPWAFVQVGRFLERVLLTANLLGVMLSHHVSSEQESFETRAYLERVAVLRSLVAFEPFQRHRGGELKLETMIDFLVLDNAFPHSIRFAVEQVQHALSRIAELTATPGHHRSDAARRAIGRLQAQLNFASPAEVLDTGLDTFIHQVVEQCHDVHDALVRAYIAYPVEEVA